MVQRPAPSWQWVFVATELSGCGLVLRHKRTRCPQAKLTGVITVDARLSWVAKKATKVEEEEEAAGRTFFLSEHRALSLCLGISGSKVQPTLRDGLNSLNSSC